jgi:hypothetical protein
VEIMNSSEHVLESEAERIPAERSQQLARAAGDAGRKAFEDPTVVADFEKWREARRLAGIA